METNTKTSARMKTINKLEFELWYGGNYCSCYPSCDKAIKIAVSTYKDNSEMMDRSDFYSIQLKGSVIAIVKPVDGNIVIE